MEFAQEEAVLQEQMLDPQEIARRKEEAAAAMRQSLNKWNLERAKRLKGGNKKGNKKSKQSKLCFCP